MAVENRAKSEKVYEHVFDDDAGDETLEVELPEVAEWRPPETDEEPALAAELDPVVEPEPKPESYEIEALRQQVRQLTETMQTREVNDARAVMHGATAKLDQDISAVKASLREATEKGDTDAAVEAMDKLAELRANRKAQELASERVPQPRQQQEPEKPLTTRWKAANPWFGDRKFAAESLAARAIDAEMDQEGYTANTPAYYEELNKRLSDKFKSIKPGSIVTKPQTTAVAPQASVRAQPGAPVKKNTVTLDARDRGIMSKLGMNPRDPKDLKAYAVAKHEEARRSAK